MSKGVLMFAFVTEGSKVNYLEVANMAAGLVHQYLQLPVTIVTNKKDAVAENADTILFVDNDTKHVRTLRGTNGNTYDINWNNSNRFDAYNLSPYDQTLLLDADYFVFSSNLIKLFDSNLEFACFDNAHDLTGAGRLAYDSHLGENSITMQWATVVYFTKSQLAESIFSMMGQISNNYFYYANLYNFRIGMYRNDFALSIALQACTGYSNKLFNKIPGKLITASSDVDISEVRKVDDNVELVFTWADQNKTKVTKISNTDIHVMNKQLFTDEKFKQAIRSVYENT